MGRGRAGRERGRWGEWGGGRGLGLWIGLVSILIV